MFLLLTLSIFHTFFYCFCRWLWTSKCYLGYFSLYCKIQQIFTCSKSTIVTLERGAEYVSHLLSSVSIVDLEQKNDLWVCVFIKILLKYCPLAWKNWSQKPWNQEYYTKLWLESVLISIHGFEQNKIFQFFGSRFFFVFRGPFVFFIPGDIQAFQILVQKIFFTHAALELHVQSKDYFKVRITCSKLFSCIYQKLLIKTAEWRQ